MHLIQSLGGDRMGKRVLDIEDLRVSFFTYAGEVQAVR